MSSTRYFESYDNKAQESLQSTHPFVRFAEDDDGRPKQQPSLVSVNAPIPKDANYASPIYLLTDGERDRLQACTNPWAVSGSSIAKELQDACEADERVLYPVHVESDDGNSLSKDQCPWIREFIEEHLPVSHFDCNGYFSGGRSLHAHVPLFVRENGLNHLRDAARDFDGDLDETIYSKKRQFRLPGVTHAKSGLPKVPIEWTWDDARIVKETNTTEPNKPATMAELLQETFGPDVLTHPDHYLWEPTGSPSIKSEPTLWEPGTPKPDGGASDKWQAYNRHAFSPYALAGKGPRSIAIVRIYAGAYGLNERVHLPCYIYNAIGCDGEMWATDGYCPVYLSKPDYGKLEDADPGTDLLIIGGGNNESRIYELTYEALNAIWDAMLDESDPDMDAGRDETLAVIEAHGYEPGRAGKNGPRDSDRQNGSEPTQAMTLQRRAESRGIESLSHQDRLTVANRLLRVQGWDGAMDWFQEQYGSQFDHDRTATYLMSIASKYDDLPDR